MEARVKHGVIFYPLQEKGVMHQTHFIEEEEGGLLATALLAG
jgi:hypothetical protein